MTDMFSDWPDTAIGDTGQGSAEVWMQSRRDGGMGGMG